MTRLASRRPGSRRRGCRQCLLGIVTAVAVSTTGCGVSLDKLPLPAPKVEGYAVTATFSNALNLPTKAKVRLNGADVGQVETMHARDYTAIVSMRIQSDVQLPAGTTAELRSATPMGDVFIELTPPAQPDPGAPNLRDGASIPLQSTSAAATIEEVLTRAALLVNGGAIQNMTSLANNLGQAVGGRGDRLATMIRETQDLVNNLSSRSDRIREVLASTGDLSATLNQQRQDVTDAMTSAGPALQTIGDNTQNIVDLVGQVDRISGQLATFHSIQGTNDRSLIQSVNQLAAGLNQASNTPEANLNGLISLVPLVMKVTNGSSAHVNVDIAKLAVGVTGDPNTVPDSGGRLPDGTDWTNFVGSLTYTLNRLQGRFEPGR